MNKLKLLFTYHPATAGETYWQHLWFAVRLAIYLFIASIACLIHAVFPFWFTNKASDMVYELVNSFSRRKW